MSAEISVPLPPDWIVEGQPDPHMQLKVTSPCGRQKSGVWRCQTSVFDYHFWYHETIVVLEGQLRVTEPDGRCYTLGPGDFGHFPCGLKARWEVQGPFKKYFFALEELDAAENHRRH